MDQSNNIIHLLNSSRIITIMVHEMKYYITWNFWSITNTKWTCCIIDCERYWHWYWKVTEYTFSKSNFTANDVINFTLVYGYSQM